MNRTDKKDLRGYAFIRNQILHMGTMPSLREVGRVVGYNSPRSVQLMLGRLHKRGLLSYVKGVVKFSSHNKSKTVERTINVPLVGSVACGQPSLAEQDFEALIPVSTRIARPGNAYLLLRARGRSMNKSGINDGDLLLVRQQPTADDGEMVVALINDDATVKHLYHDDEVIILKPNSTDPNEQSIVLSEDFIIQGVVIAVLPKSIV